MIDFRLINHNEIDDAIKLSEYSFKYILKGEEREKRADFMTRHDIIGVFEKDKMIAKTHIIPFEVIINDEKYDMGGIYGVATYPEYRRKGIVNKLMDMSLEFMKEKGHLVSYLHPFDIGFYRKYGWELISNLKKTTVEAIDFFYDKTIKGEVVRPEGFERLSDIDDIYNAYIKNYNAMMTRAKQWWIETKYDENYCPAIYYDENKIPRGYIFYKITEYVMEIAEYIYLDEESRKGLFNFISNHDSMVKKAEIMTTDDENMYFLFDNPSVKTEIIPYFMGRIVLLKAFLEKYFKNKNFEEKIVIWVKDDKALWNQGRYELLNNEIKFEQYDEIREDDIDYNKAILTDINTLTVILLGFQKIKFLNNSKKLCGDKHTINLLESNIGSNYCSFLDYF